MHNVHVGGFSFFFYFVFGIFRLPGSVFCIFLPCAFFRSLKNESELHFQYNSAFFFFFFSRKIRNQCTKKSLSVHTRCPKLSHIISQNLSILQYSSDLKSSFFIFWTNIYIKNERTCEMDSKRPKRATWSLVVLE